MWGSKGSKNVFNIFRQKSLKVNLISLIGCTGAPEVETSYQYLLEVACNRKVGGDFLLCTACFVVQRKASKTKITCSEKN